MNPSLLRCVSAGLRGILSCRGSAWCSSATHDAFPLLASHHASQLATALQSTEGSESGISFGLAAEAELFNVKVLTGRRRGAETSDSVTLQFIGTNGQTEKHPLNAPDGFPRGSVKEFQIPVPKGLGELKRLHIEKMPPEEFDRGGGWYLRQIEVESPSGERILFPCNSWIGDSDCGSIKGERTRVHASTSHGRPIHHAYLNVDSYNYINSFALHIEGALERNLLPSANELVPTYHEPVHVHAAAMAIPHPDKVKAAGAKGVNQQGFGFGGEDAYFYSAGK